MDNNFLNFIVPFLIGFGSGIIPFCYIIGQLKGIDLRKIGSGNIGATNLGRFLGLPFFILGFILDGLKGLVPVLIAQSLYLNPALAGAGAIIGHIFNPFFKFRGGKGVSTTIGVGLGIVPQSFAIGIIVWLVVYFLTYIVSLASIIFSIGLAVSILLIQEAGVSERILILVICGFIIYAHRSNIKRILKKQEPKTIFWSKE